MSELLGRLIDNLKTAQGYSLIFISRAPLDHVYNSVVDLEPYVDDLCSILNSCEEMAAIADKPR